MTKRSGAHKLQKERRRLALWERQNKGYVPNQVWDGRRWLIQRVVALIEVGTEMGEQHE